ncbi:DUF2142 domain-containing protein [Lactococcus lactis]|uniref:DUF2142 domain-containing protein n=1 Tax=Lactococcus lactis TaxID=1358 RepID=UPI000C9F7B36|nr:DUF2142 domain-containing protein [Lactococcus lactis]AUS68710.1 hypothetical protein LLG50_00880 [Lactococcus lactis subsp. lactis]
MESGILKIRKGKNKASASPERIFLSITLVFGVLAALLIPPLTTGDEGYHLSYSYNIFSSQHPRTMSEQTVRNKELEAIGDITGRADTAFYKRLMSEKVNLHNDGIGFSIFTKSGGFVPVDIMHLPAALGVLVARLIYPSIGVMSLGGRLANLLFFCIGFYFIIKKSRIKWSLILIFTVTNIQKISSPSYDVVSYLVFALFIVNLFELAKIPQIKDLKSKKIILSIISLILLLVIKRNYSFALFAFLGLPMFYGPILNFLRKSHLWAKILFGIASGMIVIFLTYLLNQKLNLVQTIKAFTNNYLNVEIMGNNAKQLWDLVPTNLPGFVNILFVLILFIVIMAEVETRWARGTVVVFAATYFINWFGIFVGFYKGNPAMAALNLQGRYLSPFTVFFVPLIQNIAKRIKIKISARAVQTLSIWTMILIMALYLVISVYRGYVLNVTPTWTNNG